MLIDQGGGTLCSHVKAWPNLENKDGNEKPSIHEGYGGFFLIRKTRTKMTKFIVAEKDEVMDKFIGTKKVQAKPMTRQQYNDYRGWDLPEDEDGNDEGYLVEYLDGGEPNHSNHTGYISWSPKEQFESAYHAYDGGTMSFGHAMDLLKEGWLVARKGWNGKGMYVYYVPAAKYEAENNLNGSMMGRYPGNLVPYNHYIALKNPDDTISTWSPSTSDALANDWVIVSGDKD